MKLLGSGGLGSVLSGLGNGGSGAGGASASGGSAATGLLSGLGAASGLVGGPGSALTGISSVLSGLGSGFLPFLSVLSDARVKDNVAPIGMLFDGTPVYSFNYIGDRTPRMGLIAQDVERRRPDAVHQIAGVKTVDYGKATQRARRIGGLLDKIKDC
jgi:hypothetical protein